MGPKISAQSKEKFQFIDGRDAQESNFTPTNQKTSLQTRKTIHSKSYQGPANGEIGQFTGLQQFIVPQKYLTFMKENPVTCQKPNIQGTGQIDPYMFKKSLNVYFGQWKNGKPHGYGKIFNPDQDYYYQGYFEAGLPSYYGIFLAENIQYHGQIKYGMAQGKGKYIEGGITIEGEFKQNFPYKNCVETSENYIFKGDYKNGAWKKGKLTWNNTKSTYDGQFLAGLMHGHGILKNLQYFYQGNFKQGKKHGNGNIILNLNEQYKGQFFQDQITGQGQLFRYNKLVYRGQFTLGVPNGQGWVLQHDKLIHCVWKNGVVVQLL